MMDDLPVFGYPINPTEICLREECRVLNCRNKEINVPLPKEFVREAWKASVGCCVERWRTHCAWNQ